MTEVLWQYSRLRLGLWVQVVETAEVWELCAQGASTATRSPTRVSKGSVTTTRRLKAQFRRSRTTLTAETTSSSRVSLLSAEETLILGLPLALDVGYRAGSASLSSTPAGLTVQLYIAAYRGADFIPTLIGTRLYQMMVDIGCTGPILPASLAHASLEQSRSPLETVIGQGTLANSKALWLLRSTQLPLWIKSQQLIATFLVGDV